MGKHTKTKEKGGNQEGNKVITKLGQLDYCGNTDEWRGYRDYYDGFSEGVRATMNERKITKFLRSVFTRPTIQRVLKEYRTPVEA